MAATMLKKCSQLDLVKPCLYSKQARYALLLESSKLKAAPIPLYKRKMLLSQA